MKISNFLLTLAAVAVLGGCALAFMHAQQIDVSERIAAEDGFRELKQLDAELNVLSLKSRFGLDKNYDKLAQIPRNINAIIARLAEGPLHDTRIEKSTVKRAFLDYKAHVINKQDLVESFKSHNSVLRNSVAYAPAAGDELIRIAEDAELPEQGLLLRETVKELLAYSLLSDVSGAEKLKLLVPRLAGLEEVLPEFARAAALEFLVHVKTVVEEKDTTDRYLAGVVEAPTAEKLAGLQAAYAAHFAAAVAGTRNFTFLLAAYALLLTAGLGYLVFLLRKHYANLNDEVRQRTAEIERTYEKLMHSERFASVAQLAAGVVQEINTPLGNVTVNVDTARASLGNLTKVLNGLERISRELRNPRPDGKAVTALLKQVIAHYRGLESKESFPSIHKRLHESREGLQEISRLVASLKDYSRLDRSVMEVVDLRKGLDLTLKVSSNLTRGRIDVETRYETIPNVECEPTKLNQVFMNIVSNAAQAIEGHGKLVVATRAADNGFVEVAFIDDGRGMNDEVQAQIFDPFFTTNQSVSGAGLGMSIAYKIVKSHGGDIRVESAPGQGTTVAVRLPVRQVQAPELQVVA